MADQQSTPQPRRPRPMTRKWAIELLKTDVPAWNKWRVAVSFWNAEEPETRVALPDLSKADLRGADLRGAILHDVNLINANLNGAWIGGADLRHANLRTANLTSTVLSNAKLLGANISGADLRTANLIGADLSAADLTEAALRCAFLFAANLTGASLDSSDFSGAYTRATVFGDLDLTNVRGLESIEHQGPSPISTDTLVRSRGRIPEVFLRGCGLKPWEIEAAKLYDPALTAKQTNDLMYSIFAARTGPLFLGGIFISYCHEDEKFVDKLYDRLMKEGANVWLDRHDAVAGRLQDQVDRAIRLNDVVVLVLSEASVDSDWVKHELKVARAKEKEEDRDVLCPVTLDGAWHAKKNDLHWERLTESLILDFSKWKTKAFDAPFQKLIKGLRTNFPRDGADAPGSAPKAG